MKVRSKLCVSASAAGFVLASVAGPAQAQSHTQPQTATQAQSAATQSESKLDSQPPGQTQRANPSGSQAGGAQIATKLAPVVVSAQRRPESVEKTPVSMSAFPSYERDAYQIRSTQDVLNFTPSASLSTTGLSIRGIGRYTTVLGSDPGVAAYTDGFYSDDPTVIGQDPLFVDRVEVLRGPQGLLYGRNSIGGAVNVISRRPSPFWTGELRTTFGNYGYTNYRGTISGPITNKLRFRINASDSNLREGYIKNEAPSGGSLGNTKSKYFEAQLEWDVTPNQQAWAKYSHYQYVGTPGYVVSPVLTTPYFTNKFFPAGSLVPNAQYGLTQTNPSVRDMYKTSEDNLGKASLTGEHRIIASYTWNIGGSGTVLKYLGGFEKSQSSAYGDYDATDRGSYLSPVNGPDPLQPPPGTPISSRYLYTTGGNTEYFSHELTLKSSDDQRFTWIVGANVYDEHLKQPYNLVAPDVAQLAQPLYGYPPYAPAAPNPSRDFYSQYGTLHSVSKAVFFDGTYAINDQYKVEAGARYTHDRKIGTEDFRDVYWNPVDSGLTSATCCSFESTPTPSTKTLTNSWKGITTRVALDWTPNASTMGYLSYSRGYKSGGFQLGQIEVNATVQAEHVNTWELGLKKDLGTFRINSDIFYNDYSNFQVPITVLAGSGVAGSITQSEFVNAQKARSYGLESEALWQPTSALQLIASYSYLHAKSVKFCCVLDITQPTAGNQDLSGNQLPQSPKNKLAVGANYTFVIPTGRLVVAGTNSYVGSQYYSVFAEDRYLGKSYNVTDFTATYNSAAHGYYVTLYLRNAFDKEYVTGLALGPATTDSPRTVAPGDPRTFGLEFGIGF